MAPTDSQDSLRGTAHGSIFLDGLDEIVAARRFEATMLAEQRADAQLVEPDTRDQQPAGKLPDPSGESHRADSGGELIRRASRLTRPASDCR